MSRHLGKLGGEVGTGFTPVLRINFAQAALGQL